MVKFYTFSASPTLGLTSFQAAFTSCKWLSHCGLEATVLTEAYDKCYDYRKCFPLHLFLGKNLSKKGIDCCSLFIPFIQGELTAVIAEKDGAQLDYWSSVRHHLYLLSQTGSYRFFLAFLSYYFLASCSTCGRRMSMNAPSEEISVAWILCLPEFFLPQESLGTWRPSFALISRALKNNIAFFSCLSTAVAIPW